MSATESKHISQRKHAKKRLSERYGIQATTQFLKNLVAYIKNGRESYPDGTSVSLIERQSLRVAKYQIVFEGESYLVVYDRKRKELVTFLPRG